MRRYEYSRDHVGVDETRASHGAIGPRNQLDVDVLNSTETQPQRENDGSKL